MRRFIRISAIVALLAVCWVGIVHGAPNRGQRLLNRIADALLGDRNMSEALVYILKNSNSTGPLIQNLSVIIDSRLENIEFEKRVFQWKPRELDKDARAIRFDDFSVVDFNMETEVTVNRSNFFSIYRNDLKLTDYDQMVELRVKDEVVDTETGSETYTKSRYRQQHKGVPVLGAQYTMYEKNGKLLSGRGALAEGVDVNVTPTISAEVALATAMSDINAEVYSWQSSTCFGTPNCIPMDNPLLIGWYCTENITGSCVPVDDELYPWACSGDITEPGSGDIVEPFPGYCSEPEGTLAIVSEHMEMQPGSYHLAWGYRVYSATPPAVHDMLVDAHSGDVIGKSNPMLGGLPTELEGSVLTSGQCSGQTEFNGVQDFTATHVATDESFPTDLYLLYQEENDTLNRPEIELRDGAPAVAWDALLPLPLEFYVTTPDMGYCSFEADATLGSSVWWALMETYDFYRGRGWIGLDGEGKKKIVAAIVYSMLEGSSYVDTGLGTGVMFFAKHPEDPPVWSVGLTDVAHEYTHGIVETAVPISFGVKSDEYYGLQEGIAMTMEQVIKASVTGQPIDSVFYDDPKSIGFPNTYKGEYWPTLPFPNVIGAPSCDSNDNWCYKYGSIFVQWFRLLTQGGSGVNDNGYEYSVAGLGDEGVGLGHAIEIILSAIEDGLKPSDGFYEMREHTLNAVKRLHPDSLLYPIRNQVMEKVQNAWAAVGVGAEVDNVFHSPKQGDPDVTPWPVSFAWEAPAASEQRLLVSMSDKFEHSFVITPDEDAPFLGDTNGMTSPRVMRKVELNLRPDRTYSWKVVTLAGDDSGASGWGFSIIPWLKDVLGIGDGSTTPSDGAYIETPVFEGSSRSPVRYFKTSKMKPEIMAPSGVTKAHPWQASFVVGDAPGAEQVWVDITDAETGEFERLIKPADEVYDDENHTYVLKTDLKVDHGYSWLASVQGPVVNDGLEPQVALGKPSASYDFSTNRPKVVLETPTAEMEVQPEAFFKWSELPGIDDMLMNGAHYRLLVSKNQDLSNPVVEMSDLFKGEQIASLPPVNSAGLPADYYWSIMPVGPSKYSEEGELATPVHFTVDASATKPVGISPDGKVGRGQPVEFHWMPVSNATAYEVRVYEENGSLVWNRTEPVGSLLTWADGSVGFTVGNVNAIVENLGWNHWDVRGIFEGNPGLPSDQLVLRVRPPRPVIITPQHGSIYTKSASEPLLFAWDAEYAPDGYRLYFFNGETCGQQTMEVVVPNENTRTYTDFLAATSEGIYSWRISIPRPDGGPAVYSLCADYHLKIEEDDTPPEDVETCTAPSTPTITAPPIIPYDTVLHPGTVVEWTASTGADHYRVVIMKEGTSGMFEEKCQYLTDTTYTMPVSNCVHELMGTYKIAILAESDSCYKVSDSASFVYWVQ